MKKLFFSFVIAISLSGLFSGCSSVGGTIFSGAHPFCGTRIIVKFVTSPFDSEPKEDYNRPSPVEWFFISLFLCADLAPSIAMDTVLLPFTCVSDYKGLSDTPYLSR